MEKSLWTKGTGSAVPQLFCPEWKRVSGRRARVQPCRNCSALNGKESLDERHGFSRAITVLPRMEKSLWTKGTGQPCRNCSAPNGKESLDERHGFSRAITVL